MKFRLALILLFSFLVTPLYAGSYFVFHSYDGTVNLGNDTAIAIRYEYDGPSPLKEALTKFFDGPTDLETEATGARKFHACESAGKIFECGASEILKSVRIENGIAYIDLSGVPGAYGSAQIMAFYVPFGLTVTQFPNVTDYLLTVMGRELDGEDFDWGCQDREKNYFCFHL